MDVVGYTRLSGVHLKKRDSKLSDSWTVEEFKFDLQLNYLGFFIQLYIGLCFKLNGLK
jgi:hypothetical protein